MRYKQTLEGSRCHGNTHRIIWGKQMSRMLPFLTAEENYKEAGKSQ